MENLVVDGVEVLNLEEGAASGCKGAAFGCMGVAFGC